MKPLQSRSKYVRVRSARRSGKRFKHLCAVGDNISTAAIEQENLLEHAMRLWQSGEWELLAKLDSYSFENHPDRAELILFAAAGHLQKGNVNEARKCIRYAQAWGCSKEKISRILIAGVYNSLGKASAINGQQLRALRHDESRISVGMPDIDCRELAQARIKHPCFQIGKYSHKSKRFSGKKFKERTFLDQEFFERSEPEIVTEEKFKDFSSAAYWENRYQKGGTSGYGSFGRLAEFKTGVINKFIAEEGIDRIIEFGCGDGNQLSSFKVGNYVGIDISSFAVEKCKKMFYGDKNKIFLTNKEFLLSPITAELTLSLDVLFHLIEDEEFEKYMFMLFNASTRFCVIYACNEDSVDTDAAHVKRRRFTDWISENIPGWRLKQIIFNEYPFYKSGNSREGSFSDFYFYEFIEKK